MADAIQVFPRRGSREDHLGRHCDTHLLASCTDGCTGLEERPTIKHREQAHEALLVLALPATLASHTREVRRSIFCGILLERWIDYELLRRSRPWRTHSTPLTK